VDILRRTTRGLARNRRCGTSSWRISATEWVTVEAASALERPRLRLAARMARVKLTRSGSTSPVLAAAEISARMA
jgi:hypothetical protein